MRNLLQIIILLTTILTLANSQASTTDLASCKANPLCGNNKDVQCLDTPVIATGLQFCKGLEGKSVCCSVANINSVATIVESHKNKMTEKAKSKDKKMDDVKKKQDSGKDAMDKLEKGSKELADAQGGSRFLQSGTSQTTSSTTTGSSSTTQGSQSTTGSSTTSTQSTMADSMKKIKELKSTVDFKAINQKTKDIQKQCQGGMKDMKETLKDYQNSRSGCFKFFLKLQSKLTCMGCMGPDQAKNFITANGKLQMKTSFCTELKKNCFKYIQLSGDASAAEMNQDKLDAKMTLCSSLGGQMKKLQEGMKGSMNTDQIEAKAIALKNTMAQIEVPIPITAKHVPTCKSETDCNYACYDIINTNEGGLKFDSLEEPGSVSTYDASINVRLLQIDGSPIFTDTAFDPETQVDSGLSETVLEFQIDPASLTSFGLKTLSLSFVTLLTLIGLFFIINH